MNRLAQQYGRSKNPGDARWVFNKMLAHPTKERGESFNYAVVLNRVLPVLVEIIGEIETLRGRPFGDLHED
jgi:hypothetical protein